MELDELEEHFPTYILRNNGITLPSTLIYIFECIYMYNIHYVALAHIPSLVMERAPFD